MTRQAVRTATPAAMGQNDSLKRLGDRAFWKQNGGSPVDITFEAESVHVSTNYRNSSVDVTVEANGRHIAEKLDLDDRLYEIDFCDIVEELGAHELMQEIGEEEVRKWLLANSDPDDTLEHIGLDKIHEFLSHGTPDGDSPV